MTSSKAAAPQPRSALQASTKWSIWKQQQTRSQELRDGLPLEGQEHFDGFSTKMALLSTNSSHQRKNIWMLPLPLRCLFFLVSLACVSPSLLPCLIRRVAEDSEIRICEFIPVTACVLSRVFLYSESISGLEALHTVHNSGFVHTLPKEQASSAQQILFCGVMTPTLLPVRPGLLLTDVGLLWVCHCHCHCQIRGDRGSKDEGRKSSFCFTDGHVPFEECRIGDKAPKYRGRVVLRGDIVKDDSGSYAVFTEQGSSASQMTAAKVMDIISRLPGCAGQAADAVSAHTQVKMEEDPKLLKIPKSECPDIWIRLPRHQWPKSWSSMEDPVFPCERNLYGHPFAGLLLERQFENILLK